MNILSVLAEIARAQKAGVSMTDPRKWANRATLTVLITALITVLAPLTAGELFDISESSASDIGTVATVVGLLISDMLHTAANKSAGEINK